jgi:hypothetical protein
MACCTSAGEIEPCAAAFAALATQVTPITQTIKTQRSPEPIVAFIANRLSSLRSGD